MGHASNPSSNPLSPASKYASSFLETLSGGGSNGGNGGGKDRSKDKDKGKDKGKGLLIVRPAVSPKCWWYPRKTPCLPDFVLISEFSEVEGPRAVMTIPEHAVDLTHDSYCNPHKRSSSLHHQHLSTASASPQEDLSLGFDVHEFVLRITSVDQQSGGEQSGTFRIPEDTQLYISDVDRQYWAFVHHFTLYDINARGFVRPFSMSFITRDPNKTLLHYEAMRKKFSKVASHFKTGNYTLFRQELTKKLRDLNYTNNLLSDHSTIPTPTNSNTDLDANGNPTQNLEGTTTTNTSPQTESFAAQEVQEGGLESIKEAMETATQIISALEHYSIDGQPLLGHSDDSPEGGIQTGPASELSSMGSAENLALLASGSSSVQRPANDSTLFLGATPRSSGSKIRRKSSVVNMGQPSSSSRILDTNSNSNVNGNSISNNMPGGIESALSPLLMGLQEQSRKNSIVSDYETVAMHETQEYVPQHATTLYPLSRDDIVFRPLRELCVVNMVWNPSIQYHLAIKMIKDIVKDFQMDALRYGHTLDNNRRMHPTVSSLTIGQRFMINFQNPDFKSSATRLPLPIETIIEPLPAVELLQSVSDLHNGSEDGQSVVAANNNSISAGYSSRPEGARGGGDADDADDEETGYDSLDDAASFFTAATGTGTHPTTPIRDTFGGVSAVERSARVAEWHQAQQSLHSGNTGLEQLTAFGPGHSLQESIPSLGYGANANVLRTPRHSIQSAVSTHVTGSLQQNQLLSSGSVLLDTLKIDTSVAKNLVFALLTGKRVCIMGRMEDEPKVRLFVAALSAFAPHPGFPLREEQLIEHQRRVVPWHQGQGLLKLEDIDHVQLLGVDIARVDANILESDKICVMDVDLSSLTNAKSYSEGTALHLIFQNLSMFKEDATFMAYADGKLYDMLLMKAFLYYHLVLEGRLFNGSVPGCQSLYTSGASDEEATFQSPSRQSFSKRGLMLGPNAKKGLPTSASVGSPLGKFLDENRADMRFQSLSSHESSDVERHQKQHQYQRYGGTWSRGQGRAHLSALGSQDLGDDGVEEETSHVVPGSMQYATSQGMRKWRRWFDNFTIKGAAAMIDPALSAFGAGGSNNNGSDIENVGRQKKRFNSGGNGSPKTPASPRRPGSPAKSPRTKSRSGSHSRTHSRSHSKTRETKGREKERDLERERRRDRKSNGLLYEDQLHQGYLSPSLSMTAAESLEMVASNAGGASRRRTVTDQGVQSEQSMDEESQEKLDDGTRPLSAMNSAKSSPSPRRLKPKRPLTLQRPRDGDFREEQEEELDEKKGDLLDSDFEEPTMPRHLTVDTKDLDLLSTGPDSASTITANSSSKKRSISATSQLEKIFHRSNGGTLSNSSSKPPTPKSISPPPSASFRGLAGAAMRAMSLSSFVSSPTTPNLSTDATTVESPTTATFAPTVATSFAEGVALMGLSSSSSTTAASSADSAATISSPLQGSISQDQKEVAPGNRTSQEFSDASFNSKSSRSAKAKAKAWFDSKMKAGGGSKDKTTPAVPVTTKDDKAVDGDDVDEFDPESELTIRARPRSKREDIKLMPTTAEEPTNDDPQSELTVRARPRSDSALLRQTVNSTRYGTSSGGSGASVLGDSATTGSNLDRITLAEFSGQDMDGSCNSIATITTNTTTAASTTTTSAITPSVSRGMMSSASSSRITSPNLLSQASFVGRTSSAATTSAAPIPDQPHVQRHARSISKATTTTRSEYDDSEFDYTGRESATEYETSLENLPGGSTASYATDRSPELDIAGNKLLPPYSSTFATPKYSHRTPHHGKKSSDASLSASAKKACSTTATTVVDDDQLLLDTKAVAAQQKLLLQQYEKEKEQENDRHQKSPVLTAEEEQLVKDLILGGSTVLAATKSFDDDWAIIVYLATMVDAYEKSKASTANTSGVNR